jgi:hypothetical protein
MPTTLRFMSGSLDVFRNNPHPITDDLEEPTSHCKPGHAPAVPNRERALAKQGHEWRVVGKDPHLSIERRRRDGIRVAVEDSRLRGDDRDSHHALASFLAFSTTSSMPPTM